MAKLLIVEDDAVFGELMMMHLEDRDHQPHWCRSLAESRATLDANGFDLILLDQQLPDGQGIDLLAEIRADEAAPPVIMVTGVSDNHLVIEAMQRGAYDFIRKPLDELALDTTIGNALQSHRLTRKISAVTTGEEYQIDLSQIVGASPAITTLCKTIGSVAASRASVLITGESGTGKEVIARALHHHSGRQGLFLPVNCSALVDNLLESELFGHERGAFTGAERRKEGKFEVASDGTLFLDEIGEMPLLLQAKLLRVLQEGQFERVGGNEQLTTTARIIAATNRDLPGRVAEGAFREDLYYRLNVVNLHLPPLRERMEDLPVLIEHLLKRINARLHTGVTRVAESALRRLGDYHWPGNVRELENLLTRAAVLCRGDTLTPDLLTLGESPAAAADPAADAGADGWTMETLDAVEARHVRRVLKAVRWHKGKACEVLGISRPSLERRIDKYGLDGDG